MQRVEKLPPAFKRFRKMHGVLDFAVFEGTGGAEEEVLSAIVQTLPDANVERLRSLGFRRLKERTFFGDWYDPDSGALIKRGRYTPADGSVLIDPKLKKLEGVTIMSGGAAIPDVGTGGQFAYAFSEPPYSLKGRPKAIQTAFEEIRDLSCRRSNTLRFSTGAALSCPKYQRTSMRAWSGGECSCLAYTSLPRAACQSSQDLQPTEAVEFLLSTPVGRSA